MPHNAISVAFFWTILFLSLAAGAMAETSLQHSLEDQFFVLEDLQGQRSFSEIASASSRADFSRPASNRASAKKDGSALWLNFSVPASDHKDESRLLIVGPAYLDDAALYRVGEGGTAAGSPALQVSGDAVPFAQKPYSNRLQVFAISADAGEYYLRAASEGILRINWEIVTEEAFLSEDRIQSMGYAVLLGVLTTMILFNLGIFLGIGDVTYVYYVGYHICAALLIYSLSGYSSQYLWPGYSNSTNISIPVALTGMSLCGPLFLNSFIEATRRLPQGAKVLRYTTVLVALMAIPGLLLPYSQGVKITYAGCFIVLAVMTYTLIVALRHKISTAKYFLIAFGVAVLPGALGAFAYEYGLLPDNLFFSHLLEVTTVAETLLLSLFLAYRIRLSETAKLRAQRKNTDLQKSFNERMLAKQEEERSRIARELHDSVGPNLSALHIHLRSQAAATAAGDTSAMMSEAQTLDLLKQTITDVRQLSHNLHPSQLDGLSLTSAIDMFTRQFNATDMPSFKLAMDVEELRIPEDKKIHLYRIVQEAVHNVINHAQASHCHLSLVAVADKIQLSVRDNGCGFDYGNGKNSGLGMTSMTDRANIMNAHLDIDTQSGEGTRITVSFSPVNYDD